MPNRDPVVTAANARKTGKDQGNINVVYRGSRGQTYLARVLGVATYLAAPATPAVNPQGATGTTTYRYRVAALDSEGGEGTATAGFQTTTGNATLDGTNFNRLTWTAVANAVGYRIYGRTGADGALLHLADVGAVTQYDDTGTATPTAGRTVPSQSTDRLRLMISTGPARIIKNNVPMATAPKQTHVYFYRY